jgi:hypothetical protein
MVMFVEVIPPEPAMTLQSLLFPLKPFVRLFVCTDNCQPMWSAGQLRCKVLPETENVMFVGL